MRGHDHLSPYLKFDFRFWTHARCLLPPRSCKITSLRLRSSDDFCWSSENLWLCVLLCYTNIESTLDREPKKHPVDGSNGSVDLDSTWSDIWHLTVWSIKIKTDFTTIPKRFFFLTLNKIINFGIFLIKNFIFKNYFWIFKNGHY
jgi:hypothetical protein